MRYLLCGLTALSLSAATAKTVPEPVRYTLAPEMTGGALTALRVQIRFRADPSGTTEIGWDDGWAGERKLWQWSREFKVTGGSAVKAIGAGHWRVTAAPGAELTATYRIVSAYDHDPMVDDSDQPRPVIRPRWFYAVGSALFAYPGQAQHAPATFDWKAAPGIGFASDLEHLAGRNRTAVRPGTLADVLESVVIGGRDLRVFPARPGENVRIATVGHYAFTPEQLDTLARKVIGVERAFWNSDRRAPFLVAAAPIVGTPTASSFGGTGRGDAFALWVDQRTPLDRMQWLLAHEYFHSWNPSRLGAMPENRDARPRQYWFSEGVTDYYARALMVRAGVITPQAFVAAWNEVLAAYAGSPVRAMAGQAAAAAFWSDEAAQKLPYQRGALLAALWNARMLTASRGTANLDTILHAQRDAARTSKAEATTLFRSLARQHGLDVAADEARYLDRGEPILLPPDTFGRCATVVTEQRPSFDRGFDAEATAAAGNVATGVDPALPAYAAGLRDGMKILARTEGEPDNATKPYGLLVEDRGAQRTIRYLPQGRVTVTVQQLRLIMPVVPICAAGLGGMAAAPGSR